MVAGDSLIPALTASVLRGSDFQVHRGFCQEVGADGRRHEQERRDQDFLYPDASSKRAEVNHGADHDGANANRGGFGWAV